MLKTLMMIAAATVLAGCAAVANNAVVSPDASKETRYWLHPKLGMVKVDAKTLAMVSERRQQPASGSTSTGTR
jgi:uncharacterized lipoprotein YajG